MARYHLRRRGFLAAIAIFTGTVLAFVGFLAWRGKDHAAVSLPQRYWLLVRACEDTTAAAVTSEVYFSGGAGYLLETEEGQAAVLACYYSESAANEVHRKMAGAGVETKVYPLVPRTFELSGKEAAEKQRILANAATADSCARILYDTANGLELTKLSQEEARAALRGAVNSLKGLIGGNGEFYARWNAALEGCVRRGTEVLQGILFAKDLRYLQVQLTAVIVNAGDYFP